MIRPLNDSRSRQAGRHRVLHVACAVAGLAVASGAMYLVATSGAAAWRIILAVACTIVAYLLLAQADWHCRRASAFNEPVDDTDSIAWYGGQEDEE